MGGWDGRGTYNKDLFNSNCIIACAYIVSLHNQLWDGLCENPDDIKDVCKHSQVLSCDEYYVDETG